MKRPIESTESRKSKRIAKQNKPFFHLWQLLIAPFIGDLKTLVSLRLVSHAFTKLTGTNVWKQVPIGPYSLQQYQTMCGNYQSTSVMHVEYNSLWAQEQRENILEWQRQFRLLPPGHLIQHDTRFEAKPNFSVCHSQHIFQIHVRTKLQVYLDITYESGPSEVDEVVIYSSQSNNLRARLYEYLPHSHVIVKCWLSSCIFDIQLFNVVKSYWKLTIVHPNSTPTAAVFHLKSNATEIVFQNWILCTRDRLELPRVKTIVIDYRARQMSHIYLETIVEFLRDVFLKHRTLQKIVLLCDQDQPHFPDMVNVEVHLQSSIPKVSVEEYTEPMPT